MNPIHKILVPVDFSEPSRSALTYAAQLARAFDATIDVLHVWEVPVFVPPEFGMSAGPDLSLSELTRQNAERLLAAFVEDAAKRGIHVQAAHTLAGVPSMTIVDAAKAGNYDLIVIGTHGRTGLSRALIGSVAERVVRHSSCAVLTVRHGTAS
jgi:universal stress protein A